MIDLKKFDIKSFFNSADLILDEFKNQNMPPECYGWRSWKIEKSFCQSSKGELNHLFDQQGRDFKDSEGFFYEFKQVKNAFKDIETPEIIIKNYYKNCLGKPKKTFDYLIVFDIDRKALGIYDWDLVNQNLNVSDARITVKLKTSKAVQFLSIYDEIFENTP